MNYNTKDKTLLPRETGEVDFKTVSQGNNAARVVQTALSLRTSNSKGKQLSFYHFPLLVLKTPNPALNRKWDSRKRDKGKDTNNDKPGEPLYPISQLVERLDLGYILKWRVISREK